MFNVFEFFLTRDRTMENFPANLFSLFLKSVQYNSLDWVFNVFHDYTKTLIINKCTKRVLSSIVTHSYMFRPGWVIFRENLFVIVTLRLHFIVEWECAVDCVLCTGGVNSLRSGPAGRDHWEFTPPVHSTQSTAHSHWTIKCNLSVTITKRFSLKMTQQGRNM
jgi:hypothetical protein